MQEEKKVYRTRSQAITIGVLLPILIALGVDGAVRGHSATAITLAFGGPLLLFFVIGGIHAALTALVVSDLGVIVRNPFRTVSIAGRDRGVRNRTLQTARLLCRIRRLDQTIVPAFAIQGITGQPRRRTSVMAHQTVDELNERLRETRSDHVASARTLGPQARRPIAQPDPLGGDPRPLRCDVGRLSLVALCGTLDPATVTAVCSPPTRNLWSRRGTRDRASVR